MPQVKKAEIRARILDGALAVFARDGVETATMTGIAAAAGIGAASIYRYYASKDELFAAVITPELTKRFETLLARRVRGLAQRLLRGERADDAADEMMQFWIANRLAVVILLDTPYGERFVDLLMKHTIAELGRLAPPQRFVLRAIFEGTRRLLARVLAEHADPAELRAAIETFWSYQVAGLRGLATHVLTGRRS
jgi:AcrR family transcriptional regulator